MKFFTPIYFFLIFLFFNNNHVYSAMVCKGNIQNQINVENSDHKEADKLSNFKEPISTFLQPIITSFTDHFLTRFFVILSSEDKTNLPNEFTISKLHKYQPLFMPLCPEKIQINQYGDQPNPFYNQPPALCSFAYRSGENDELDRILLIHKEHNTVLWTLYGNATPILVNAINLSTQENYIPDASGRISKGAVALKGTTGNAFLIVKPHEGEFGDSGTGIAFAVYGDYSSTEDKKIENLFFFDPYDKVQQRKEGIRAYSFDRTSSFLHLNTHELSKLSSTIMHWSSSTNSMYFGINGTSGNNEQDAICGIAIGKISEDKKGFTIKNFVDNSAIVKGKNQLFAARGAKVSTQIYHINSMFASVWGDYLIVNGGTEKEYENKRSVFALPLIRSDDTDLNGTLASKNGTFEETFNELTVEFAKKKSLAAITSDDLYEYKDNSTCVGTGLSCGPIEQLFIDADTVFICIKNPDFGHLPGIFSSQALFTSTGSLKGWTPWKRAYGINDPVDQAFYNTNLANMSFITTDSSKQSTVVKQTRWNIAQPDRKNLYSLITEQFPLTTDGIHAASWYDHYTPGVGDNSFMVISGFNKVGLIQTTKTDKITKEQVPVTQDEYLNIQECTDFTEPEPNKRTLIFSGAQLQDLGPISTHAIGTDNSHAWLFVASYNGIAVLSNDSDFCGWSMEDGIGDCFTGFTHDKIGFKKVGNLTRIKKLYADSHFLYALTDKTVERIDLIEWHKTTKFKSVTIAHIEQLEGLDSYGSFFDLIISDSFACLGTSKGLYRIQDNYDVRTISSLDKWALVETPERIGAILNLSVTSNTGRPQDIAKFNGGHIYAVGSYRGNNQSVLYRFSCNSVADQGVTENTLRLFRDGFIPDNPTYFCNFGSCISHFITDGSQYFSTPIKLKNELPAINTIPSILVGKLSALALYVKRSGYRSLGAKSSPIFQGPVGKIINSIFREMNNGRWFVTGDFGLSIHE